jgi:hypothetical protein
MNNNTINNNITDYGINLGNIIQIQDFNADIMAFAGYLSIAIVPLCFSITQRGFNAIGSNIGSLMQSSAISNTSSSVAEVISGNYSLGNTSIGNDSLFNSSKFNINEGNRSVDNDSIGNKSYNNLTKDSKTINTSSENVHSKDITTSNMHSANKVDTASSIVRGGTETITERGIGTLTFGSDGKLSSMQQERTSLENSVSKSEGVSNSDNEQRSVGGGFSIGIDGNKNGIGFGSGKENPNILDKIAGKIGFNANIGENSTSQTTHSSGVEMKNDQAFAKETIDYINNKYDSKYMKDNMDVVFKDANEFQKTLAGTKDVDSTKTIYTYGKEALTPNSGVKAEAMTKELDEFEKSLKDKK